MKEFLNIAKKNNIEYERIIEKMKYEGLWNELIVNRYGSFLKVNKEKLRKELQVKISQSKNMNIAGINFRFRNWRRF